MEQNIESTRQLTIENTFCCFEQTQVRTQDVIRCKSVKKEDTFHLVQEVKVQKGERFTEGWGSKVQMLQEAHELFMSANWEQVCDQGLLTGGEVIEGVARFKERWTEDGRQTNTCIHFQNNIVLGGLRPLSAFLVHKSPVHQVNSNTGRS